MSTHINLKICPPTGFLLCLNLVVFWDPATSLDLLPLLSHFQ